MIRVDRGLVPPPPVLSTKRTMTERRRAEEYFGPLRTRSSTSVSPKGSTSSKRGAQKAAPAKPPVTFSIYRHEDIKAALNLLFHGKCAYCESRYIATQPMDVEHFRPKSEITDLDGGPPIRPGYYWLASEWANLLPSCIDCNRPRNHQGPNGEIVRLGKATLFPLAPKSPRARFGESIEAERPLLLDPCRDRPEDYLIFSEGVAEHSSTPSSPIDAAIRVAASITVYGLNRTELVQERLRVLLDLRRRFHLIRNLTVALEKVRRISPEPPGVALSLADLVSHEVDALWRMAEPTQPYSLMVSQEIAAFEREVADGVN